MFITLPMLFVYPKYFIKIDLLFKNANETVITFKRISFILKLGLLAF